jgi:hypothetical protein
MLEIVYFLNIFLFTTLIDWINQMIFLLNQLHNTIHWFNLLSNKKNTYISYIEQNGIIKRQLKSNKMTSSRHETQSLDQINDENTKKNVF